MDTTNDQPLSGVPARGAAPLALMRLTLNDHLPVTGVGHMQVSELRDHLVNFNQAAPIAVAIPLLGKPHEPRAIRVVGHLDHPGQIMNSPDHPGALDIVCDSWDAPPANSDRVETITDLTRLLAPYPDAMHVRVTVPVTHASVSHRMLDIVYIGSAVGAGKGIQLICENWDFPSQVLKELPAVATARRAEYDRLAASVPPGEALPAAGA